MSNANATFDVAKVTTAELVAKYNELTGKSIKKFSSRAAGEKQVLAFLSAKPKADNKDNATAKKAAASFAKDEIDTAKAASKKAMLDLAKQTTSGASDLAKQAASIAKSAAKKKADKEATVSRSDAVSASWEDPAVKEARSTKNKVKVAGVEYRSVKSAFEALKLPLEKHIGFRAELKASGRKTFDGHVFTIVASAD